MNARGVASASQTSRCFKRGCVKVGGASTDSVEVNMVQLPPSLTLDIPPSTGPSMEEEKDPKAGGSPKRGGGGGADTLQLSVEFSTAYYDYETYIEDGLICLKHKVRNLEKKKLKLEEYEKKLKRGEELNKDQMAAVEKHEELLHNLTFARELHKTLEGLTQSLLNAQKKALKKEQVAKVETDRKRLTKILQLQHVLSSLQLEHIRRDLLAGHNQAPYVSSQKLQNLTQLASLLEVKKDNRLSLEEQMEQVAHIYLDLLEGQEKPVAGSSYKMLKADLLRLLDCRYFSFPQSPPKVSLEVLQTIPNPSAIQKSKPKEVPKEFFNRRSFSDTGTPHMRTPNNLNWHEDKEREPPDCWEMELPDGASPQASVRKPWKGGATYIPKMVKKQPANSKLRKEKKAKDEQTAKLAVQMELPMEVVCTLSALPKDPTLRKQQIEELITNIHSSFSFMQESLLDGERSHMISQLQLKRQSVESSPIGQPELRSPVLPKPMHSTPRPVRLLECKERLTNGVHDQVMCDLDFSKDLLVPEKKQFCSPPLYHRESPISRSLEEKCHPRTPNADSKKHSPCNRLVSSISTPPQGQTFPTPPARTTLTPVQFQRIQSVFKVNNPLPQKLNDPTVFPELRRNSASTQTPAEFAPSADEMQSVYQLEYTESNGGQLLLSPGQSSGSWSRSGQLNDSRGSMRGGSYTSQMVRDLGPVLYNSRDPGFQHGYRQDRGRSNSNTAWNDSSQVSSPDRGGSFTIMDSGLGDSMSVSTGEVPLTPHSQHQSSLVPMQLYPISQPLRVAFTASRTANFAPGNLDQPVVFDQLQSNLGGMYDPHIGRFTCPVNGTYFFIFHILKLAINIPLYVNLMCNEEVMVSAYANDGAPDHETASNHAILPLFQGDQLWLRLHRGAIYGSTWKYSTFSGFLLYQD
ncbi:caprin-2 isoform X2 [Gouania willdenowi]|uniref:caprin-2 isoform X2 n=1 Tax=Gouania willdenowi TaxID=441366 RepID=UPI0010568990|nr:caprin-2 isoform X2 [Gouania willdenowi]